MMNRNKFERVESLLTEAKKNLNQAMKRDSEELQEFDRRKAFLSEFERACERFDVEFELEEERSKDEVYSEWSDHVNMSASELQKWSKNPCSRQASEDPSAVMKRNLRLLERNKEDWTENDVEDAERTISFISRMKENRPESPREGPHGCPSEWAISLLNWAFNPFDSVPTPSSEVKDDLDSVEKITLQQRKNIKEAEMLAEHVWVMKDVLMDAGREFEDYALTLEETRSEEEVEQVRSELEERIDLLREKVDAQASQIEGSEEMSDSRQASQVVHGDQEKHLGSEGESDDDEGSVRVPPVAIHKVEGGSQVKVDDDVEKVLDELWQDNE